MMRPIACSPLLLALIGCGKDLPHSADEPAAASNVKHAGAGPAATKSASPSASLDSEQAKVARGHALVESGNYGAPGALGMVVGSNAAAPIAFDDEATSTMGTAKTDGPVRDDGNDVDIQGRLSAAVIRQIVRASFPRFQDCYDAGRKRDPELKGVVTTRFIVDTTGSVESANSAGGTLADSSVVTCVVKVFNSLSFPEPQGGKVRVTYPLSFRAQ